MRYLLIIFLLLTPSRVFTQRSYLITAGFCINQFDANKSDWYITDQSQRYIYGKALPSIGLGVTLRQDTIGNFSIKQNFFASFLRSSHIIEFYKYYDSSVYFKPGYYKENYIYISYKPEFIGKYFYIAPSVHFVPRISYNTGNDDSKKSLSLFGLIDSTNYESLVKPFEFRIGIEIGFYFYKKQIQLGLHPIYSFSPAFTTIYPPNNLVKFYQGTIGLFLYYNFQSVRKSR